MSDTSAELTRAATALAEAFDAFERLAASAQRIPLDSQKNLEKAAKAAAECAASQDAVVSCIRGLGEALGRAGKQNEATVAQVQARSQEIRDRTEELNALLARVRTLGDEASQVSTSAADVLDVGPEQVAAGGVDAQLEGIEQRLTNLVEQTREIGEDAQRRNLRDVVDHAHALRQQVQSARNRILLLRQKMVAN